MARLDKLHAMREAHSLNLERWHRITATRFPRWQTRRRRRAVVCLLVAGSLSMVVAALIPHRGDSALFLALWGGGGAVGLASIIALRLLTGRISTGFGTALDEREREWRDRIHHIGFQALISLMIVAMLYQLFTARQPDAGIRGATMLSALVVLGGSVPMLVLGWQLPDDDPEDFAPSHEEDFDA